MAVSVFDMFKIGVGPSSSHTVGPMRAARQFLVDLEGKQLFDKTAQVVVQLYGSLALTGKGHGTDRAILLGLEGETPDGVDPDGIADRLNAIRKLGRIKLLGKRDIPFDEALDLLFHRDQVLPKHSNGLRFTALDAAKQTLLTDEFYSIGGGFIVRSSEMEGDAAAADVKLPYPFSSGDELLALCAKHKLRIPQLMMANEKAWRPEAETRAGLIKIWEVMKACAARGMREGGELPGGLKVIRRAPILHARLAAQKKTTALDAMDWLNLWALAVNEENAAGGRVVTAPTNGAAGIIPSVLHYYMRFVPGASEDGVVRFLLTAAAIGTIYKEGASISGAEVGCQGEVGSACSMAAGALCEVLGGNPRQVENAAEIGMEHNLGLTCDPVGGLVQIPCIERNAMGSIKAINAARMALRGHGTHVVSLDKVIKTMRETGADMKVKYKETSRGGLAVNVIEC